MRWLAIAVYRCEVAGSPTDSLDFRVRMFDLEERGRVEDALTRESPGTYLNPEGEEVAWPLSMILAIEPFEEPPSGDEVVGFISNLEEMSTWTRPGAPGEAPEPP